MENKNNNKNMPGGIQTENEETVMSRSIEKKAPELSDTEMDAVSGGAGEFDYDGYKFTCDKVFSALFKMFYAHGVTNTCPIYRQEHGDDTHTCLDCQHFYTDSPDPSAFWR